MTKEDVIQRFKDDTNELILVTKTFVDNRDRLINIMGSYSDEEMDLISDFDYSTDKEIVELFEISDKLNERLFEYQYGL